METNKIIEKQAELIELYKTALEYPFVMGGINWKVTTGCLEQEIRELSALQSSPTPTESKDEVLREEFKRFAKWKDETRPYSQVINFDKVIDDYLTSNKIKNE
jgi:hypothetical protein